MDITGIGTAVTSVKDIIGMFFPDKTAEEQAKIAAALQMVQGQMNIDQAAQEHEDFTFRDGAGWVCVLGFTLMVLKAPIEWVCTLSGHPVTLPTIDTSTTTPLLMGLLGLGGMHLYENTKGS